VTVSYEVEVADPRHRGCHRYVIKEPSLSPAKGVLSHHLHQIPNSEYPNNSQSQTTIPFYQPFLKRTITNTSNMSSIVNKVKDAISHKSSSDHDASHTTTTAPRGTSTTTSAHDGSYTSSNNYTHGGTQGPATHTDGPHSSNMANKADPRVDSDRDYSRNMGANPSGTATTGTTHGTHGTTGAGLTGSHGTTGAGIGSTGHSANVGPHSSNMANKADPRVDSDLDGNRGLGSNTYGTTGTHGSGLTGSHGTTGTGLTGSHGTTGTTGYGSTGHSNTTAPHSSNIANKLDPRVDNTYGSTGTHGTTGTGLTGSHGTTGTTGYGSTGHSTNVGPHSSNMANKVDPRVDSNLDGNRGLGSNTYGTTGTHGTTGTGVGTTSSTGTHSAGMSGIKGVVQPTHGSSGLTGSTGTHGTHTGTHGTTGLSSNPGPAPNTSGPHKSDAMNKIDPRVDSDRDGSKTVGGDKTYSRPDHTTNQYRDPTDAAQVPPSVLQKHLGPPTVAHEDDEYDHSRRHSVSHQEQHRGL
ncbi:hypothetical protein S40288_09156, partial [Stachybotrys chartarum IBT 40288]